MQLMKTTLFFPCVLAIVAAPLIAASAVHAAAEDENQECLSCHGNEDMTVTLENGQEASLFMNAEHLASSVHKQLRCVDCHADNAEVPHPERTFKDVAAFRASFKDTCNKCHAENQKKMLDSVHGKLQAQGNSKVPTCTSCHGAHDVVRPAEPRTRIAATCGACHKELAEKYVHSVHGQALAQGNPDVPTCTDCHNPHDMPDPRERAWVLNSPQQCGKCHADPKRMDKYHLSTAVMATYLNDFHGTTASFGLSARDKNDKRRVAVCGDCHGVHDTAKATGPAATALRARLIEVCRRCHTGASDNLSSAWLGHREASIVAAPVVFSIKLFYVVVIPTILGGLILQIILHLRRSLRRR